MKELHIITPVKDSIDTTMETIDAIMASRLTWPHTFTIYNDFSTPENTATLARAAREKKFSLINLSDMTSHASPNYLLILQEAQRKALAADAGLLIVESDVIVAPDTLQRLADEAVQRSQCGIAAAVTVDDEGRINYPTFMLKGARIKSSTVASIAVFAVRCSPLHCFKLLISAHWILAKTGTM